jgi:uncharacterized protein
MTIFVDADACPVKDEVYRVARRHGLPVVVVANAPIRVPADERVSLVVVGRDFDAADDWIVERVSAQDVVVSADVPLAARCVAKGAQVLGTTGLPFTEENVGDALATRNLLAELREHGAVTSGPAPFQKRDRSRFLQELEQMIQRARRRSGGS